MELKIFQNAGFQIRGGLIDNEPYFVAKDVCEALSIEKYRDAVARLDDDERGSLVVDTLGGNQEMTALNEMSESQAVTFENFVQMLRISPLNIEAKITLLITMRRSLRA